eukprot:3255222-Rhodomonas_salina.2
MNNSISGLRILPGMRHRFPVRSFALCVGDRVVAGGATHIRCNGEGKKRLQARAGKHEGC